MASNDEKANRGKANKCDERKRHKNFPRNNLISSSADIDTEYEEHDQRI